MEQLSPRVQLLLKASAVGFVLMAFAGTVSSFYAVLLHNSRRAPVHLMCWKQ